MSTECYRVIKADTIAKLEELVRHANENGYTPIGGVCVAVWPPSEDYPEEYTAFYQAVACLGRKR